MLAIVGYFDFLSSSGYSPDVQGERDDEEESDGRTKIIYAVSEIGTITDFIKAHPMYTIDDYKWNLNPRFIRIMCIDNTRIHYMSERESKMENAIMINSADDLMNDLGMNIDISKNKNLKIIE